MYTARWMPCTAGAQNNRDRDLRTHLRRAWRAGEHSLWPDVALAAVLSLAAALLTLREGDGSGGGGRLVASPPEPSDGPLPAPLPAPPSGVARDLVLNLLITVPLIGRRRWPLACLTVQFAGLLAFEHGVNAATLAALLIGAYSRSTDARCCCR